jgi:hypothetical protein
VLWSAQKEGSEPEKLGAGARGFSLFGFAFGLKSQRRRAKLLRESLGSVRSFFEPYSATQRPGEEPALRDPLGAGGSQESAGVAREEGRGWTEGVERRE